MLKGEKSLWEWDNVLQFPYGMWYFSKHNVMQPEKLKSIIEFWKDLEISKKFENNNYLLF